MRLFIGAFFAVILLHVSVYAQIEAVDVAPPPMKVLPKDEEERLKRSRDVGARTKLALSMMNDRLAEAESQNERQNYVEMFRELGHFHALVDDSLDYLNRNNTGRGKVLDNFKRLEIGLRKFLPRLEAVRRELPLKYEDYVRTLMIRIRDARTKATEPLFGDTVLPQSRSNP
jgi:hypothetical protein